MKFLINHTLSQTLWLLLGSNGFLVVAEEFRRDVQLLMYETDASTIEQNPRTPLHFVKERSSVAHLKTTVYGGGGLPFRGFGDKYQTLRPLLEIANPETLIILADTRDTVLNVPDDEDIARAVVDEFVERFHILTQEKPNAVVVSAEAQCCVSAMAHANPSEYFDADTGRRNKRACSSGLLGCQWSDNDNVHSWVSFMNQRAFNTTGQEGHTGGDVYLNAGLMVGYPKDLMKLIDVLDIEPTEDDQAVLTGLMYTYPDMITLDYKQEMFGNNQWTRGIDGCVFEGNGSSLIHLETRTQPLMIHTPGKFYSCLDIIMEALGGQSQQRYHLDERKLMTGRMSLAGQLGLGGAAKDDDVANDDNNVQQTPENIENYGSYGQYGGYGNNGQYSNSGNYRTDNTDGVVSGNYGQYGNQYGNYGSYGSYTSTDNYGYRRPDSHRKLLRKRLLV